MRVRKSPEFVRLLQRTGRSIIVLRQGKGWSRGILARRLGVTKACLGRWERGERQPPIGMLLYLQELLGLDTWEAKAAEEWKEVPHDSMR